MPAPKWRRQYSSKFLGSLAPGGLQLGFDHAEKALLDHLGRQPVEIGLEGIERGRAVREDARLAFHLHHLVGQDLSHELLHARVAQVQPVAGPIEAVALALAGDGQAAQVALALEQHPGLAQVQGGGDSGQASAQNDDVAGGFWL